MFYQSIQMVSISKPRKVLLLLSSASNISPTLKLVDILFFLMNFGLYWPVYFGRLSKRLSFRCLENVLRKGRDFISWVIFVHIFGPKTLIDFSLTLLWRGGALKLVLKKPGRVWMVRFRTVCLKIWGKGSAVVSIHKVGLTHM